MAAEWPQTCSLPGSWVCRHVPQEPALQDATAATSLVVLLRYQFNPAFFQTTVTAQILLKALTNLPHTDFTLCKCMIDQAHVSLQHVGAGKQGWRALCMPLEKKKKVPAQCWASLRCCTVLLCPKVYTEVKGQLREAVLPSLL